MQTINPLVVSVGPAAGTTPIYPTQLIEHGGGVKKVIAVAAMVVIPVAAPAIASSIAASGVLGAAVSGAMATTAGAVVSSAIVGAGLGAVTAKVTGTSVKAGAIGGALGGAFGGYRSAAANTFATPQGGISGTTDRILGTNFSGANANTANTTQLASADGSIVNASADGTVQNAVLDSSTDAVVGAGTEATFMEKMASVPSKIADKITNPDTLANLTLQAGGQLLATALVPPGSMPELSPEEAQVLEEYKAELADLKQNNEAAFNAKMDASKQFLVQAGYFSPEYFGLQAANTAATDQERKLREYRRTAGLTNFRNTGMSAAEERRAALQGGRNVQSAYDSGFQKGMTSQNQALSTGYGMIPKGDASYANALAGLANTYSGLRAQEDKKRENIAEFFGGLNVASGNTEEDKKKLKKQKDGEAPSGGLNTTSFTSGTAIA